MRKLDILHLFIYLMIFIILSNWYINFVLIQILGLVNFIIFIYCLIAIKIQIKYKKGKIKNEKS